MHCMHDREMQECQEEMEREENRESKGLQVIPELLEDLAYQ